MSACAALPARASVRGCLPQHPLPLHHCSSHTKPKTGCRLAYAGSTLLLSPPSRRSGDSFPARYLQPTLPSPGRQSSTLATFLQSCLSQEAPRTYKSGYVSTRHSTAQLMCTARNLAHIITHSPCQPMPSASWQGNAVNTVP